MSSAIISLCQRLAVSKRVRFSILRRDCFRCQYCGGLEDIHVDHFWPVAFGGDNDPNNLLAACRACNLGKGVSFVVADMLPAALAWKYLERYAERLGFIITDAIESARALGVNPLLVAADWQCDKPLDSDAARERLETLGQLMDIQ